MYLQEIQKRRKEVNEVDKARLRSIIVLNGDTQGVLAKVMGCSQQTLSAKINEKEGSEFTQSDIRAIKDRYDLTPEEVDAIFFKVSVSN